ncbi:TIGR02449 family protein [Granulosicoccus sp. 3-233]|uniref:TIGR02449 family protein n=1 Tax=Granulosicoccus sp. 3-233 TaxID=3417969 RepID=UPI003D330F33
MSRPALEEQFELLETRLQALIALCTRLRQENQVLHQQQESLVEERARLIDKNETARNKVEQMIVRLKSLEVSQ